MEKGNRQSSTRFGLKVWKEGMEQKSTLKWYKLEEKPKMESFYCGDKKSELLFKARTCSLETNSRTYRWNESKTKLCLKCNLHEEETIEHLLRNCPFYSDHRDTFIDNMKLKVGESEWVKISRRTEDSDMIYLLGLAGERNKLAIEETMDYIYAIWSKREMD